MTRTTISLTEFLKQKEAAQAVLDDPERHAHAVDWAKRWMRANVPDDIQRCEAEQRRCADHIAAGLPDSAGAMRGAADWIMEETLRTSTVPSDAGIARSKTAGQDK